jgi:hypothetical protein
MCLQVICYFFVKVGLRWVSVAANESRWSEHYKSLGDVRKLKFGVLSELQRDSGIVTSSAIGWFACIFEQGKSTCIYSCVCVCVFYEWNDEM